MPDDRRDRVEPTDIPEVTTASDEHGFFESDEVASAAQPEARAERSSGHSGIFRDPVVRRMTYVAFGLVIIFLITVVSAIITGVLGTGGPRTLAEKEIAVTGAAVRAGSTDPAVWSAYISALIDDGQYRRAGDVLRDARASVEDSATAEISIAEVRLLHAQGRSEQALTVADQAMAQIQEFYDAKIAAGGSMAQMARIEGIPENYYTAILLKAYIYRDASDWGNAIAQYDLYLEQYPTAADILIDRGVAKIEAGDDVGAEADLNAALMFDDTNEEALEALERIGVTR